MAFSDLRQLNLGRPPTAMHQSAGEWGSAYDIAGDADAARVESFG